MATPNTLWWLLPALALAVLVPTGRDIPPRWAGLKQLHPQVQSAFVALFEAIEATGYQVVLTSGYRGGTEAADFHYFGLAQDINLIHIASGKWYRAADKFDKATWEATGVPAIIRAHGFRWGGDFTTPWVYQGKTYPAYDPIHTDLGLRFPIAQLRAKAKLLAKNKPLSQFDGRKVPLTA